MNRYLRIGLTLSTAFSVFLSPASTVYASAECPTINEKYNEFGGAAFFGNTTHEEATTADGAGIYWHGDWASMFWHPNTCAHEISGEIRDKYASIGWELGYGYPLTDESGTPDGIGRYNHFEWASRVSLFR